MVTITCESRIKEIFSKHIEPVKSLPDIYVRIDNMGEFKQEIINFLYKSLARSKQTLKRTHMQDLDKKLIEIILTDKKLTAPIQTSRMGTHWEWIIGIGKDYTATLTMTDEAYKEILNKQPQ